ncbi:MAG: DUF115 domain-containing protein [bacterium]|nr:DUF115 domain-containing protein [bacterium]
MLNIVRKIKRRIEAENLAYSHRGVLRRNVALKDIKKGGRCFIIGNGPSINDQDLLRLKNEQTIVVNSFWNYNKYKELDPKYYVLLDGDVFPRLDQKMNFFVEQFLSKMNLLSSRSTEFFFHISSKDFMEKKDVFPNNKIHYIFSQGHFKDNLDFNIDINKIIPYGKNVIVSSIMIAAYMGFEEIYLLGCEHDFLAYPSYKHYEKFPHFFSNPYDLSEKEDAGYYAMSIMPYENHIYSSLILFKNYRLLKEKLAIEKPAIKIYNATPNSFLDVFPMVKFEDIKI